jgi:mannitol/fructose-specific phosphotransferase system IIA component (Ntr-type)
MIPSCVSQETSARVGSSSRRGAVVQMARGVLAQRKPMTISDVLTHDLVIPTLEARGAEDAISTLSSRLATAHADVDGAQLVEVLLARERQVTTALGDGVAIPHARIPGLERTVAAFGRSPDGIAWGSLDGRPTQLVLLLAGPASTPGTYLKTLASVSRLLGDRRCRERLLASDDPGALVTILREEELRFGRVRPAA